MPRYKITIEYDGGGFAGWQRQENAGSVQQAIEEAIGKFSHEAVTVFGAGRTDSGVHALGQVAHFDLGREFRTDTVRDAINFHLKPAPVSVLGCEIADGNFHARFDAVGRVYRYRIINRRSPPALNRGGKWWVPVPLDAGAMDQAAKALVGVHDFTTFRAVICQAKSPVKTVSALDVERRGDEITIRAEARSFLHRQVRNFVGTLKLVGEGKWTVDDVRVALEARDRSAGGPTAPAQGLYLVKVIY
ncbi:MAG: tRNA pseudouridine(38-40) synthase TruA [Rhodospirillales bacterium RIFCSPLOWO2_12_FULL_58_28]|nr:MAG: tRNA pseudouridine(38-40) synthase TruA [Rhodospirillales bacterium RIFCSPLOWO2_02_FULL_58_16]OHC77442.1 MAG: tRNA pseudouridine(38-40) synthase TruA [Rhodospirillales bacterium RIFCSPLOWO2_12_FULL_58_28]